MAGSTIPPLGDQKPVYKRAIAKMMVFWIINSRHTWRERLLKFNPNISDAAPQTDPEFNKWESDLPALAGAFNISGTFDRVIWNNFFRHAYTVVKVPTVQDALAMVNMVADFEWVPMLDPYCPADEAINRMLELIFSDIDSRP